MPTYVFDIAFNVTVGTTSIEAPIHSTITKTENGFDVGVFSFDDENSKLRGTLTKGSTITVQVKDVNAQSSYTTLFYGIIRFVTETLNNEENEVLVATCDGIGWQLAETLCAEEYGSESNNSTLDTVSEISTDIIDNFVEKILGGSASGHTITGVIDSLSGSLPYLYFPYKPCSKAINDAIDLYQAKQGSSAGAHWMVTTGAKFLLTPVGNHSAAVIAEGWTTYVDGSATNATITQGIDFYQTHFENMNSQSNYILYYSDWLKPGNIDYCETDTNWAGNGLTVSYDDTVYKVGSKSLKIAGSGEVSSNFTFHLSSAMHLNLDKAGGAYTIPTLNFWARRNAAFTYTLTLMYLMHDGTSPLDATVYQAGSCDWINALTDVDTWYFITLPLGRNWRRANTSSISSTFWDQWVGDDDTWSDLNYIYFILSGVPSGGYLWIDGAYFSGVVCRAAKNSTLIGSDGVKMFCINDQYGKDDTLNTTTDGTVALLAKAELLRRQTSPIVATLTTPLMLNALPGQLLHVHARPNLANTNQIDADYRITQIIHTITKDGGVSKFTVTSDVINSVARAAYDSLNEVKKNERPENQDRQQTAIKMRDIDITVPVLEVDYA